ncbi:ribokinase [Arthrobacter sp. 2RAF6]|uniref:ribokinase n=1 Tax=Arthrobacter sp. 2RAF6 TaxID=3233002 RepID=UPI003F918C2C
MTTPIILDVDTGIDALGSIIVVGSMNADLTVRTSRLPLAGETVIGQGLSRRAGGKGSNQAVAAALLGAEVHLIASVGEDEDGAYLRQAAAQSGVATDMIGTESGCGTGTALITVDDSAENFIVVSPGANARLRPDFVEQSLLALKKAAVLCLSLEVPLATIHTAARAATSLGAITILNLSPYTAAAETLLPLIDVLVLNELEAIAALNLPEIPRERPWQVVGALLGETGTKNAVVTLGADGAVVMENLQTWPITPVHIEPTKISPVDTTGCGDAFAGALAVGLAKGEGLIAAASFAGKVAAYAATGHGAQNSYPSHTRLHEWMSRIPF